MQHHAVIITGSDKKDMETVWAKTMEFFKPVQLEIMSHPDSFMVSPILISPMNKYFTIFIAPDGSKEGWETSDLGDTARKELLDWLREQNRNDSDEAIFVDYVELTYGGDDDENQIIRCSGEED